MDGETRGRKLAAILGLGNPGRRYALNRHNFGTMIADRLAFLKKEEFIRGPGPFVHCRMRLDDLSVLVCKSTTYMNNVGRAAKAIGDLFGIAAAEMLVISDDCNLPLGTIRFRPDGSDGGHNGLASIISYLQSRDFPRLRLGIGINPPGVPLEDYVLDDFGEDEQRIVDKVISTATGMLTDLARNGLPDESMTVAIADEEN
jgi:PTH1 family peptidyl-tRNA hydrolase